MNILLPNTVNKMDAGADKKLDVHFQSFQKQVANFKEAREDYFFSYCKDPLANFIIHRLRLTPLKCFFAAIFLVLVVYGIGYLQFLLMDKMVVGITRSTLDFVYDILLIPSTFAFYTWMAYHPGYVFLRILDNGARLGDNNQIQSFISRAVNRIINHRAIFLFSLAIMILLAVLSIHKALVSSPQLKVIAHNSWIFCMLKVPFLWGIGWYMAATIFVRMGLIILVFRRLFKQPTFSFNIFHQDHCGGMKPLSEFLASFSYYLMICAIGLIILIVRGESLGYYPADWITKGAVVLYLGFIGLVVFFPLHPFHRLLKRVKGKFNQKMQMNRFFPLWAFTPDTIFKIAFAALAPTILLLII